MLTRKQRDVMQVRAFHLVYKVLGDDDYYFHNPLLRFVTAIGRTCDDVVDKILDVNPDAFGEWMKMPKTRRPTM